jgi:hypothetical protein
MIPLLLVYGLFNAICVAVLVLLAQDAPMVDDDPLPAALLVLPMNDNEEAHGSAEAEPAVAAAGPRLRPMHLVA